MRLKTHIRVGALLRRAEIAGVPAQIVRKGDPDAGALFVKVFLGRIDGAASARLYAQGFDDEGSPCWREPFSNVAAEADVDAFLEKERRFDRDLWIVEIEDRLGRNFLDD